MFSPGVLVCWPLQVCSLVTILQGKRSWSGFDIPRRTKLLHHNRHRTPYEDVHLISIWLIQSCRQSTCMCDKRHGGTIWYKETGACFSCGQYGHLIRDCPLKKDPQAQKTKEWKSKPKVEGRVLQWHARMLKAS